MYEMVTGVGRQLLPIRSPHLLCTLFRSRLREREEKKKALKRTASPWCWQSSRAEMTALKKEELSWCFVYIKPISVNKETTDRQSKDNTEKLYPRCSSS